MVNRISAFLCGAKSSKIPGISDLPGVPLDISSVRETLNEVYQSPHIYKTPENFSESDLKKSLADFMIEARKRSSEIIYFYYSGHGVRTLKGSFNLICPNSEYHDVDTLKFSDVLEILQLYESKLAIVILDCCFAGAATEVLQTNVTNQIFHDSAYVLQSTNICLISAAGANESARFDTETGRSFFTSTLCRGISSGFADVNADGWISKNDLESYLKSELSTIDQNPVIFEGNRANLSIPVNANLSVPVEQKRPSVFGPRCFCPWDGPQVWNAIREAKERVYIFQTWLPGGQAEVARYGPARQGVDYKICLIEPQAKFVELRIKNRLDFEFALGALDGEKFRAAKRVEECARELSRSGYENNIRFFDGFAPGPIYIVDDEIFLGFYLPHIDASVGPKIIMATNSNTGRVITSYVESKWESGFAIEDKSKLENDTFKDKNILERLHQIERELAWLQYPANPNNGKKSTAQAGVYIHETIPINRINEILKYSENRIIYAGNGGMMKEVSPSFVNSSARRKYMSIANRGSEFGNLIKTNGCNQKLAQRLFSQGVHIGLNNSFFIPGPIIVGDEKVFLGAFELCDTEEGGLFIEAQTDNLIGQSILAAAESCVRFGSDF